RALPPSSRWWTTRRTRGSSRRCARAYARSSRAPPRRKRSWPPLKRRRRAWLFWNRRWVERLRAATLFFPAAHLARPREALTPREVKVLAMVAEGLSNKTIARRLGISEHTVKFHVSSIFAKLGVSSRTEAVTLGVRRGLIML